MLADVQHHDHEEKEHHDGSGVNNQLECSQKGRAQYVENYGNRQQRNNQIQQRMYGVISSNCDEGCENGNRSGDVKGNQHNFSGQQTMKVDWRGLVFRLALVFASNGHSCNAPKVVIGIFSGPVHQ